MLLESRVDFKKWHPELRLTEEEAEVGLSVGTNVLLGRSGTGKTVCVVARILRDTNANQYESRLFVTRSSKLRDHVRRELELRARYTTCKITDKTGMDVGGEGGFGTAFGTIDDFSAAVAKRLLERGEVSQQWPRRMRTTFWYFERVIFPQLYLTTVREKKEHKQQTGAIKLTAALVWGELRRAVKGSVAAAMQGRPLSEEEYIAGNLAGTSRKREADELERLKPKIYTICERYQAYLVREGRWDDMDRALSSCSALKAVIGREGKVKALQGLQLKFDRVFVDEVQDFLQVELVLAGYCCSGTPRSMFFAGDNAQTIEQGANFSFADTRIMADAVFPEHKGKGTALGKLHVLSKNYRSHHGILNVAAFIIKTICRFFPAGVSPAEDEGIALGPRPMIGQCETTETTHFTVNFYAIYATQRNYVQPTSVPPRDGKPFGLFYADGAQY